MAVNITKSVKCCSEVNEHELYFDTSGALVTSQDVLRYKKETSE